jgi:enoyl-[acyl-carrier protein] reductase II
LEQAYSRGTSTTELEQLLGRGRAKKGMFEGDLIEGELEIGQIAGLIESILPASEVVKEIITEFNQAKLEQNSPKYSFND